MDAETTDDAITQLQHLVADQRIVMLTTTRTVDGQAVLDARPLTALDTDEQGSVWFLVSRSSDWVRNATAGSVALFTGADDGDGSWFSVSGALYLVDDRDRMAELWNPLAGAWFEGADDPDLLAIRVQAHELSWWDSPSSGLVRLWKVAKAALGGDEDEVGDHGTETIATT